MKKPATIILTFGLLVALAIIFVGSSNQSEEPLGNQNNVEVKDGVQYVTINARGGYSPQNSVAQSGIPTKLVVKTSGTFDCSLSLVIRSIGFQKILEQTGEEIIDIGIPKAGEPLLGVCSMGMYNFEVDFS